MPDTSPVNDLAVNRAHETRDVHVAVLVLLGLSLAITAAILFALLWILYRSVASDASGRDVSIPVRMPGESSVNIRIKAIPQPRLDALEPLSTRNSPDIHAEDLRADRQPILKTYEWVDRDKGIARIPIEQAMEAILDSVRPATSSKKGRQP